MAPPRKAPQGRKPPIELPPAHLKRATLRKVTDLYIAHAATTSQAKSTTASRAVITRAMREILGDERETWTLTSDDFETVFRNMVNGPSPEEVTRRIATGRRPRRGRTSATGIDRVKVVLRHFAKWMAKRQYLDHDITLEEEEEFPSGKKYLVEPANHKIFDYELWPSILHHAEMIHPRVRMAVATGLYCGRRINEVLSWRWEDMLQLSLNRDDIKFFDTKNGIHVYTPLYKDIREELERYYFYVVDNYGEPQADWFLVPSRKYGSEITGINSRMGIYENPATWPLMMTRPASLQTMNQDVRKLLHNFGLEHFGRAIGPNEGTGTHSWRRSAACRIADLYGLAEAQAFCGHASRQTTELYVKNREGYKSLKRNLMAYGMAGPDGQELPDNVISLQLGFKRKTA